MSKILPTSALWLAATGAAFAHPHIFIDARVHIEMSDNGQITGITHVWTFDPLFSSWLVQGIERDASGRLDQQRLDEIAIHDVSELQHYGYYTHVIADGEDLTFRAEGTVGIEEVNGRLMLAFDISPVDAGRLYREYSIAIFDPHYYTAFSFNDPDAFIITGTSDGCAVERQEAAALPDSILSRLAELPTNVYELPPELAAAIGGREGRLIVTCETPLD